MYHKELAKDFKRGDVYDKNTDLKYKYPSHTYQEVVLDTLEPCGTNFKKNREALEACQQLVENRALVSFRDLLCYNIKQGDTVLQFII